MIPGAGAGGGAGGGGDHIIGGAGSWSGSPLPRAQGLSVSSK